MLPFAGHDPDMSTGIALDHHENVTICKHAGPQGILRQQELGHSGSLAEIEDHTLVASFLPDASEPPGCLNRTPASSNKHCLSSAGVT